MPARLAASLKRLPFVANAWTDADLLRTQRDSFAVLERRSLYPGRAGAELTAFGVEVQYAEGFLDRPRGSGHGSPWWYDRHVPIVLMGADVTPGKDGARVASVDVAPTLAAMLGVKPPSGLDGKALAGIKAR